MALAVFCMQASVLPVITAAGSFGQLRAGIGIGVGAHRWRALESAPGESRFHFELAEVNDQGVAGFHDCPGTSSP